MSVFYLTQGIEFTTLQILFEEFHSEVNHADDQYVLRNCDLSVFFDDERHKFPHIHAKYQGQEASF